MRRLIIPSLLLLSAASALAVTTSQWTQTAEAEFLAGRLNAVVASEQGDVRLSRSLDTLVEDNPLLNITYAIRRLPDGSIAVASGPQPIVLRCRGKEVTTLFRPAKGTMIGALEIDGQGRLLAGVCGEAAELFRIDPASGQAQLLFRSVESKFIWAIEPMPDGSVLLGTGPDGELVELSPDGKRRTLFKGVQRNILSILPDESPDQVLIGADPDGLVIRVDRKTGQWFVLYDAAEPEIVALGRDAKGVVYAAASSAVETEQSMSPPQLPGRPQPQEQSPLDRQTLPQPVLPQRPDDLPDDSQSIPRDPVKRMVVLDSADQPTPPAASQGEAIPARIPTQQPAGQPGQSAVYRIDRAGFVSEVFRRSVTIHSMLVTQDSITLGTGPAGQVFELLPATEQVFSLAQTDARQVSAMATGADGKIFLGLSNPGAVAQMGSGYARRGEYVSQVLDAGQVAQFGHIRLQGTLAPAAAVTVAARSGNVQDPEIGGWSEWSEEKLAAEFVAPAVTPARFFQYRLTLTTSNPTQTPVIEQVATSYLVPNLAPKISAVMIEPQAAESADVSPSTHQVSWQASDPNNDPLIYSLYYRLGHQGDWILLKDKITEGSYAWNTRQLADGRYQLRLVASDAPFNAAGEALSGFRFSDPLIVDNTPPVIGDTKFEQKKGELHVRVRVADRTGMVALVQYAVDSSGDWQAVPSSDMLYDSPDETVEFVVRGLSLGRHQLTLRARDSRGNTVYETLVVTVQE